MNSEHILLHLSLLKGVGPAVINHLIKTISVEQLADIYQFQATDFVERCCLRLQTAQNLEAGLAQHQLLEQELMLIAKHKIQLLTILNPLYSSLLRTIHLPPAVVYVQGRMPQEHDACIAVVGSRSGTAYGKRAIQALIPPLVAQQWHIVSGGAMGIDAFAHQATLQAGGTTIAVLGSGLLQWYPVENRRLFTEILEKNGTLLSAFPMNMEPLQGNFPARNRIIAGLSRACVVVQAAQKSGASITAKFALEQGREVFAVPGCFDDPLSAGCHALLKQGAHVLTSAEDILQEFGQEHKYIVAEKVVASEIKPGEDNSLLSLCKYPISIDELEQKTGLSLVDLQTALFDLQLEGKVMQNFMGMWQTQ